MICRDGAGDRSRGRAREKREPRPGLELHLDLGPEKAAEARHDRQAQPQALPAVPGEIVELPKLLEDLRQLVGVDPNPGVDHVEPEAFAAPADAEQNGALQRVAERVLEQVAQDPIHHLVVGAGAKVARRKTQGETFGFRPRSILVGEVLRKLPDIDAGDQRVDHAGVELRNVENAAEQAGQAVDRRLRHRRRLENVGTARRLPLDDGQQQRQRLHRLTQIVTRRGQQLRLGQIGAFRLGFRHFQRHLGLLARADVARDDGDGDGYSMRIENWRQAQRDLDLAGGFRDRGTLEPYGLTLRQLLEYPVDIVGPLRRNSACGSFARPPRPRRSRRAARRRRSSW